MGEKNRSFYYHETAIKKGKQSEKIVQSLFFYCDKYWLILQQININIFKKNKRSCTQVEVDTTVYNRAGGKGSYGEVKVKRKFYVMFFSHEKVTSFWFS